MKKILICGANAALETFFAERGFIVVKESGGEDASVILARGRDWERSVTDARAPVVVLSPAGKREETARRVPDAAVLELPVSPALLLETLRVLWSVEGRIRELDSENERLKSALDEMKLVDRAKCALIQYLGMTEKDAHRFLEKQAMDRRVSRRDVALDILKTYES